MTNSPDFLSKVFAKHCLIALSIVSYTVNTNNKLNNTSSALLGTNVLKVNLACIQQLWMQYQKDAFLQSPHQKYGPF